MGRWVHRNLLWSLRGTPRLLVGVYEQRKRLDASTIPSCMCSSSHHIFHNHRRRCLIPRSKCAAQAAVSHLLRGDMVGWKEDWFWSSGCQLDLSGIVFTYGQSATPVCSLLTVYFWVWKWTARKTPKSGGAEGCLVHSGSEIKKIVTPSDHSLHQRWEVS